MTLAEPFPLSWQRSKSIHISSHVNLPTLGSKSWQCPHFTDKEAARPAGEDMKPAPLLGGAAGIPAEASLHPDGATHSSSSNLCYYGSFKDMKDTSAASWSPTHHPFSIPDISNPVSYRISIAKFLIWLTGHNDFIKIPVLSPLSGRSIRECVLEEWEEGSVDSVSLTSGPSLCTPLGFLTFLIQIPR